MGCLTWLVEVEREADIVDGESNITVVLSGFAYRTGFV